MRILIVEDNPVDSELIEMELRMSGLLFDSRRVENRAAFVKAIDEFSPALILCDYSLPKFRGDSALEIALARCPEVPFIFVSGALGEELAIDLLKKGATDYVLKDRLARLVPAVTRAIQEIQERAERRNAENALRNSEIRYRTIFENTGTATIIADADGTILLANREFEGLTGYKRKVLEKGKNWTRFILKEDLERIARLKPSRPVLSGDNFEIRIASRKGEIRHALMTLAVISGTAQRVISLLDITDRKGAETSLRKREQELDLKSQSLEEANTALKVLLQHREEDKKGFEEKVVSNLNKLVFPYIEKIKHLRLDENQRAHVSIIESHLKDIASPFLKTMTTRYLSLTPREIQISSLVREGRTTKDITDLLNLSPAAVDFHRKNIRMKFGIKNQKANLRSFLLSLSE